MINQNQIVSENLGSKVTLKFSSREPEYSIIAMLSDFTRINYSCNVESFTIKTQTVTRFDINKVVCPNCKAIRPVSLIHCECGDNG